MSVTKGQQQARIIFANYCNRIDRYVGGFQRRADENGKQYIGCQFCVCRYTEHTSSEAGGKNADVNADLIRPFKKVIDDWASSWTESVTAADVGITNDPNIVRIGDAYYDWNIIKKMLKTFGKTVMLGVKNHEPNGLLYIADKDGNEGVLCSMRYNPDNERR